MGYYVQTTKNRGKALEIVTRHNGQLVSQEVAERCVSDLTRGVIVVVDNGMFEAAAFAYNEDEFAAFTQPNDARKKEFVVLSREDVERLSGFK